MLDAGDYFLLLSGEPTDAAVLTDSALLQSVLEDFPGIIDMHRLCAPVVTVAENNPGLEGYVAIDASNITISTYVTSPLRIVACIHSCRPFASEGVIEHLRRAFGLTKIRSLTCTDRDFL